MRLLDIPAGRSVPDILNMIVEIPKGSRNKYEYDTRYDCFRLDRVLASPMHYPTAYGFVPGTLYSDGDPLDIMVLIDEPTFTGCLIEVRPIGMLRLIDGGFADDKIISVPIADKHFSEYVSIENMKPHTRVEIEYFYGVYKDLEGKQTQVDGWADVDQAHRSIIESVERFRKPPEELISSTSGQSDNGV